MQLGRRHEQRARLLRALVAAQDALGEDGPFLVYSSPEMAVLCKTVEDACNQVRNDVDLHAAIDSMAAIEGAGRSTLYAYFLELARPELARFLRLLDADLAAAGTGEGLDDLRAAAGDRARR